MKRRNHCSEQPCKKIKVDNLKNNDEKILINPSNISNVDKLVQLFDHLLFDEPQLKNDMRAL